MLATEASSPAFRLALAGGTVTVTAMSGGIATALGTAIGGAMGLQGAAATSAGLAWLGGGSLAAGGYGMAGGAMVVTASAKATYAGTRFVATSLAAKSARTVVLEGRRSWSSQWRRIRRCANPPWRSWGKLRSEVEQKQQPGDESAKSLRAIDCVSRRLTDSPAQAVARRVLRPVPVPKAQEWVDRWADRKAQDG